VKTFPDYVSWILILGLLRSLHWHGLPGLLLQLYYKKTWENVTNNCYEWSVTNSYEWTLCTQMFYTCVPLLIMA